jgi:NAD(P)H-hydrate epimerase
VTVCLSAPAATLDGAAGHQLTILEQFGIRVDPPGASIPFQAADLIIDALIGYSLRGAPVGPASEMIDSANAADPGILSLDIPSGVDADTGNAPDSAIRADATLTLALPKRGLLKDTARRYVGELHLADIGVRAELYGRPPLCFEVVPPFARGDVVRLF